MISSIADTLYHAIKIMGIITVCAVFMVAINSLLGLLGSFVSTTVFGELVSLMSMYLPFNAGPFFATLLVVGNGILAFKVANKIFTLTSWGISSA